MIFDHAVDNCSLCLETSCTADVLDIWKDSFEVYSTSSISFYYMPETVRTLTITEAEETALVEIIRYFNDMGLPDNVDSTDYDTLTEKVCEPAFWEYN